MTLFSVVQAVIIALIVLTSAVVAFRKLLPKTATRLQAQMSASFNQPDRANWMRVIGRRIQPAAATGSCGDGCGSCGSCGPTPQSDTQPLNFRPRTK
jgi:CBS domain containing-hemolysin-like protein